MAPGTDDGPAELVNHRDPAARDDRAPRATTRLVDVAARLRPLLPAAALPALDDALVRVRTSSTRVLVIGEAKRGKSTLVNALFDRDLLPTGVLPLTSVATVVTVGSDMAAEARFLNGRTEPIATGEIADLVSERGNPSNIRGLDQVRIMAPSAVLPLGVDVVDTPGTGSVHQANTVEAGRARATVDVAVLVVSADPPVSSAELTLITEAMATASAAILVINKIDLVDPGDLDSIVAFTRAAVTASVGVELPVIPMSLRAEAHESAEALGLWLSARIAEHGTDDVLASTSRALRREASAVLDQLRVTQTLLRHDDQDAVATVAALREILDRANRASTAAVDHLASEARRARAILDGQYEVEATAALRAARSLLGSSLPEDSTTPEMQVAQLRDQLGSLAVARCQVWFGHIVEETNAMLAAAAEQAINDLDQRLTAARQAAEQLLRLRLAEARTPEPVRPPAPPTLSLGEPVAWRELVTATIAAHLPAGVRRRRLHAQLREWAESAVPRPFGRARAGVQDWLREAGRKLESSVHELWRDRLAALERGLDSAAARRDATGAELADQQREVSERIALIEQALDELDMVLAVVSDAGHGRATVC